MKPDDETLESREINELRETVKQLQHIKEKLQRSEERYRFLTEHSVDAIWRLDDQLRFVYVSSAAKNLLGYQPEEIVGRHLFEILVQESIDTVSQGYASRKALQEAGQRWGSSTYTVEVIHKEGHPIWMEVTVNPIFGTGNQLIGYNGITRDISVRRRDEEVIHQYAFRDPLTNLPNRRSFEEELGRVIDQHKDFNKSFAVMFLDVDGLKKVNDAYGHSIGDALLQVVADRVCHVMRKQDFIARLAGDEFVAILPGIGDNSAIDLLATRLVESFYQTILIGAHKVRIGVSIGISFFPEDADSVNTLISYADQAMYEAKKNGGSKYVCYG
ncbi:hypothetical protein SPSIL_049580 [Sporomusa silvacetica DSM 10669]|uniref:Diguanylate cyclase n=1 Tax=Sporomusa silvacetica DSM 10669 TaxID=1123289 RepID=A0ABZ3ISW4_9FIRM|nr:diguanylate cyclase [Sporomusa silvacetica]OZC15437.1 putative diguanylate cyclase YegE [Sporomusa silvacetica DSM 10669]